MVMNNIMEDYHFVCGLVSAMVCAGLTVAILPAPTEAMGNTARELDREQLEAMSSGKPLRGDHKQRIDVSLPLNTTFRPGDSVTLEVDIAPELTVQRVKFKPHWGRSLAEGLTIQNRRPYEASYTLPDVRVGKQAISVFVETGDTVYHEKITVPLEIPIQRIELRHKSSVPVLNNLEKGKVYTILEGEILPMESEMVFPDGEDVSLHKMSGKVRYSSTDSSVLRVEKPRPLSPSFNHTRAVGPGTAAIVIRYKGYVDTGRYWHVEEFAPQRDIQEIKIDSLEITSGPYAGGEDVNNLKLGSSIGLNLTLKFRVNSRNHNFEILYREHNDLEFLNKKNWFQLTSTNTNVIKICNQNNPISAFGRAISPGEVNLVVKVGNKSVKSKTINVIKDKISVPKNRGFKTWEYYKKNPCK